jgi:hypothetical protein
VHRRRGKNATPIFWRENGRAISFSESDLNPCPAVIAIYPEVPVVYRSGVVLTCGHGRGGRLGHGSETMQLTPR